MHLQTCASALCTPDKFQGYNVLHPVPIVGHIFLRQVPIIACRGTSQQCHHLFPMNDLSKKKFMETISAIRLESTKVEGKCNTKQVVIKKKSGSHSVKKKGG